MNLLSQLDSFKNNQKIISYDQSTNDIINAILRQHNTLILIMAMFTVLLKGFLII